MGNEVTEQTKLERAIAADYLDITNEQHDLLRRAAHRYACIRRTNEAPEQLDSTLDSLIKHSYNIVPIHEREEQDAATAG